MTVKKSEKEIAQEKDENVAYWCSFYRENPHRFCKDYLNVNLKLFQKILIYAMMKYDYLMFIASRGLGKTFLTALFCVVRCILFPGTKICVAAGTRVQGNEVITKIIEELCMTNGYGSINLNKEIKYKCVNSTSGVILFYNGSWIKVVTPRDTARGNRANLIICDEFRLIKEEVIRTVLKRFLASPRQPEFLKKDPKKYAHLKERNKEIYMSSAWYCTHWSYKKAKTYTKNFFNDAKKYFICALPYQIAILENLLMREQVEEEMAEDDFDEVTFSMEMGAKFYGDTSGSFYNFEQIENSRKLKNAVYPIVNSSNKVKDLPELLPDEQRILSVDIALMSSKKNKNDASSIMINQALPTGNNTLTGNIIYLENFEGFTTDDLALIIRRYFHIYNCNNLVIDTNGSGLGVYDELIKDMLDPDTGEVYPALSCCNDKVMAERCKVDNAPKVIWSIKANKQFNNDICILLRNGFQKGKINLLIQDYEADEILTKKVKNYKNLDVTEQMNLKMPYIQTKLLVYELVNLKYETDGSTVKVYETSGNRKDRYSSLAYNYWVQCQLEQKLSDDTRKGFSMNEYATLLNKCNRKPISY